MCHRKNDVTSTEKNRTNLAFSAYFSKHMRSQYFGIIYIVDSLRLHLWTVITKKNEVNKSNSNRKSRKIRQLRKRFWWNSILRSLVWNNHWKRIIRNRQIKWTWNRSEWWIYHFLWIKMISSQMNVRPKLSSNQTAAKCTGFKTYAEPFFLFVFNRLFPLFEKQK